MQKHSMSSVKARTLLLLSALAMGAAFPAHAQKASSPCNAQAWAARPDAIAAIAEPPPLSSAQAAFKRADTNGDGRLNAQEAEHFPAMAPHFKLIDKDRNNFLSFEELSRAASDQT